MATLSKKITRITLPIDYLELTDELGLHNFEYGANLWRKDRILENRLQIFPNIEGESQGHNEESEPLVPWSWIENHCLICQYSLDIRKCDDFSCCLPKHAEEAAAILSVMDFYHSD